MPWQKNVKNCERASHMIQICIYTNHVKNIMSQKKFKKNSRAGFSLGMFVKC